MFCCVVISLGILRYCIATSLPLPVEWNTSSISMPENCQKHLLLFPTQYLGGLLSWGIGRGRVRWVPLREMGLNVNSRDYTAQWSEEGRIFYSLLSRLTRPAKERSALSSREGGRLLLEKWPRDRRPGSAQSVSVRHTDYPQPHCTLPSSLLSSLPFVV